MPHVSERRPVEDDDRRDRADGPLGRPSGELDREPRNADETVPRDLVPDAPGAGRHHPGAVDNEPGSDR
jgi:hypothetical protein